MGRRGRQNKKIPKPLKPGKESFPHWGRRMDEVFPDRTPSPSTTPRPDHAESSSSLQIFEYQHPDSPGDISSQDANVSTSREPRTGSHSNTRPHRVSLRRPTRVTQPTGGSSTNGTFEHLTRPARRSLRMRSNSRLSRHVIDHLMNDSEATDPPSESTMTRTPPTPPTLLLPIDQLLDGNTGHYTYTPLPSSGESQAYPTQGHRQSDNLNLPRFSLSPAMSPQLRVGSSYIAPSTQIGQYTHGSSHAHIQRSFSEQGLSTGPSHSGLEGLQPFMPGAEYADYSRAHSTTPNSELFGSYHPESRSSPLSAFSSLALNPPSIIDAAVTESFGSYSPFHRSQYLHPNSMRSRIYDDYLVNSTGVDSSSYHSYPGSIGSHISSSQSPDASSMSDSSSDSNTASDMATGTNSALPSYPDSMTQYSSLNSNINREDNFNSVSDFRGSPSISHNPSDMSFFSSSQSPTGMTLSPPPMTSDAYGTHPSLAHSGSHFTRAIASSASTSHTTQQRVAYASAFGPNQSANDQDIIFPSNMSYESDVPAPYMYQESLPSGLPGRTLPAGGVHRSHPRANSTPSSSIHRELGSRPSNADINSNSSTRWTHPRSSTYPPTHSLLPNNLESSSNSYGDLNSTGPNHWGNSWGY